VHRLTTDALLLGLVLAFTLTALGWALLDMALHVLEGDLPTHGMASAYMRIWLMGLPFVFLPMVGNMAVRATGDTVTPSALLIIGVVINAILDPLLIFGVGPFPRLEIAGAAWATVISRGLTCAVVMWILGVRDRMLTSPLVPVKHVLASWRLLLKNGIPIALNNLITPIRTGALTRMTAMLGAGAVAGFGVAKRVEAFGLTAIFALQAVIGIFIAQNAGANKWDRVSGGLRTAERFGFLWGLGVFVLLAAVGKTVAAWFDPAPEVVDAAYKYFLIAGALFCLRGVYFVGSAGLNSLNHAGAATTLTVVHSLGIAVPAAWLGARLWGLPGLFAGVALGNFVGGVTTGYWLRRTIRREAGRALAGNS